MAEYRDTDPSSPDARDVLRAATDALIDPHALLQAVRDPNGQVVDFTFIDVNPAVSEYLQRGHHDLIGSSLVEILPDIESSGLLQRYRLCIQTGDPLVLEDFKYYNPYHRTFRRYDLRAARAGTDWISMTWRDVTERYRHVLEQVDQFRLLVENSGDVIMHVRDDVILWVSPSVEGASGFSPAALVGRSIVDFLAPESSAARTEMLQAVARGESVTRRALLINAGGTKDWNEIHAKPFLDAEGHPDGLILTIRRIDDLVAAERAEARFHRLLETSNVGMSLNTPDSRFEVVNAALCDFLGYDAETLTTMTWPEITPPEDHDEDFRRAQEMLAGQLDTYRVTQRFVRADGHIVWGELSAGCLRAGDGTVENFFSQITDVTSELRMRKKLEEALLQQAKSEALYRRSMDSAAVGMCLASPEGAFIDANQALCKFFGYDAETLLQKTWVELTAADYLQADLDNIADLQAGRIDSYRMVKQYIHADGHRIWGDLAVGCIREPNGSVEILIAQVVDITDEVESRERLAQGEMENRALAERLSAEISSAARYVTSILPQPLVSPVRVSSCYLPSRELGGDSFDYRWLDEDHLMVYVIDVSGHGVDSALLAVSIHNLLRSGTLPEAALLEPARVLTELNRLFKMESHDGKYFTIWYGVYEKSTSTMRYASAGHPPALAFSSGANSMGANSIAKLSTKSIPLGIMAEHVPICGSHHMPRDSQLLIYSDGAYEALRVDAPRYPFAQFVDLCSDVAAGPRWSLDALVEHLRSLTEGGEFVDDCSLVLLEFD